MSASYDPMMVFLGSFVAHAVCSGVAVTGGRYVANYVSERLLTIFGGALFVIFGIITIYNL